MFFLKRLVTLFILSFMSTLVHATPWFSGPLYADWGVVTPIGHGYWRAYGDTTSNYGIFDTNHNLIQAPHSATDNARSIFGYGLTKNVDTELVLTYVKNQNELRSSSNIGDTSVKLGFQLMRQDEHDSPVNLRLTLGEIFPTGPYNRLNPNKEGTDGTGGGSYLTQIGLHFQHLSEIIETHYLCTRASVVFTYANQVPLTGFSVFGGTPLTRGYISPGNSTMFALSGEYSLTQNWVAVLEGFIYTQQASTFNGKLNAAVESNFLQLSSKKIIFNRLLPSNHNIGGQLDIGNGNVSELSLAPALEYNFTQYVGVIGGVLFSVSGKNTPAFVSSAVAVTISW